MKPAEATTAHKETKRMAEDEHTWMLWSVVVSAVVGMYGLFVKHIVGHTDKAEINRLRDTVQYKDNCTEIVKGVNGEMQNINKKLDRLIDYHMKEQ